MHVLMPLVGQSVQGVTEVTAARHNRSKWRNAIPVRHEQAKFGSCASFLFVLCMHHHKLSATLRAFKPVGPVQAVLQAEFSQHDVRALLLLLGLQGLHRG